MKNTGSVGESTREIIIPDEVLPFNATIRGYEALPPGFTPMEPIPVGFVLNTVLSKSELMDTDTAARFVRDGRRLRYKYGRDNVFTTQNVITISSMHEPESISLAEFIRHNSKPLPVITRMRRSMSRAVFGIKCDINF